MYTLKTWHQLGETNIDVSFMGISENSEFFNFLINGLHIYKVKKIPMSEALKDRD